MSESIDRITNHLNYRHFMNLIPDPLHPAVVHFPIAVILLGTLVSVIAVFWRKGYVPAMAAALRSLAESRLH